MRLIEIFSGIGAFAKALTNLGIPHERIAMCEIDPHAIRVYEALHGPTPNLGDISKVEYLPDCDLLTYSFPCQDLSIAGRRAGMAKGTGTRSSLLWQVGRLLAEAKKRGNLPEYLVMENVDAITHKSNASNFASWRAALTSMGYTSVYQIMNAADYGVPQNRRRCFLVSRLGSKRFVFPPPCPDDRVLRDILESEVPPKYYLSDKAILGLKAHKARHDANGHGFGFKITNPERERAGTVKANGGWRNTDTLIRVADLPTIMTGTGTGTVTPDLRIRRLTPRECWRLQGLGDAYDTAAAIGLADTHLYRLAGNTIAVPVAEAIFKAMFSKNSWVGAPTLERWV